MLNFWTSFLVYGSANVKMCTTILTENTYKCENLVFVCLKWDQIQFMSWWMADIGWRNQWKNCKNDECDWVDILSHFFPMKMPKGDFYLCIYYYEFFL